MCPNVIENMFLFTIQHTFCKFVILLFKTVIVNENLFPKIWTRQANKNNPYETRYLISGIKTHEMADCTVINSLKRLIHVGILPGSTCANYLQLLSN